MREIVRRGCNLNSGMKPCIYSVTPQHILEKQEGSFRNFLLTWSFCVCLQDLEVNFKLMCTDS